MRRHWLLLLFAMALAAIVAACGGGDDSVSQNACGLATSNNCDAPTAWSAAASPGKLLFPEATKDGPTLGNSDAPVAIELWMSLRCAHCHAFVYSALPQIVSTYVDTGKIKLTIRNAALSDAAVEAHSALECAGDQGKYWEAFDALNFNFTDNDTDYARDKINGRLDGSGVDLTAIDACLDAATHKSEVLADVDEIKATNFAVLPVIIIGGDKVDSLETFAQAQTFIDAHLAQP